MQAKDHAVGETVERPATYEDVLAAPPHLIAELIHGRLVTHPRPAPRHARAASRLSMVLGPPFDQGLSGPGGWVLLYEPELHFGPEERCEIAVPDKAGWRRERMPKLPETAYFTTVPDWTCELLSPSSDWDDRERKPGIYASYGVPYYWLGDPLAQTLETFVLERGIWRSTGLFRESDEVAAAPFEAVPFGLGKLWMGEARLLQADADVVCSEQGRD